MGRIIAILVCVVAIGAGGARVVSTASVRVGTPGTRITTSVGPTRLLSPVFGYTVAYRTVERGDTAKTTIALFAYDHGRWSNVTPPTLAADANAIDDVAFSDRRHGWVAAYNCAEAAVHLYRTNDGGRTWQLLGKPASHSCGGGPTFLSFVDPKHGWMEPVSPNAPGGELLRTTDGGQTWTKVASDFGPGSAALPCLAPITFVSRRAGWMARCERRGATDAHVFSTRDAGRHWTDTKIAAPHSSRARVCGYDLPRFVGKVGVAAATLGDVAGKEVPCRTARAVSFSVSGDTGRTWSTRPLRPIAPCGLRLSGPFYISFWPASVAGTRVWWIVAGRQQTLVQVTSDSGRHWQTVAARGLPAQVCAVTAVSAATARLAWVVARYDAAYDKALFQTRDGGRTWHRVTPLHA